MAHFRIGILLLSGVILCGFGSDASANRGKTTFKGKTTNQVLSEMRRAGNKFGASHRNERNLMSHQRRNYAGDSGYRTTGNSLKRTQGSQRDTVNAAKEELNRRLSHTSDPRKKSEIRRAINDVERSMSRNESRTRGYEDYLKVFNYRGKTW